MPAPRLESLVYFIGGLEGPVKIGLTNDAWRRLSILQTGNAVRLYILATVAGSRAEELEYHLRFARSRIRGEWFHRTDALMAEIRHINPEVETMLEDDRRTAAEHKRLDEYKITDPAQMLITRTGPLPYHPGVYLRDVILPNHGFKKIAPLAERLKVNRPNLHEVLSGKRDVSRELAYRLGALLGDQVADFAIAYQHRWDLEQEAGRRAELRQEIDRMPATAD